MLRKAAKVIANDRRKRKEKHRLLQRWVYDRYKSGPVGGEDEVGVVLSDDESSPEPATTPRNPRKGGVWDEKASLGGFNGLKGVTLRTMLRTAKDCYKLAAHGFDQMSLYGHLSHILGVMKEPDAPLSQTIVCRAVVVMAQHQQHFARENLAACLARLAVMSNLPEDMKGSVKTCRNCFDKFRATSTPPVSDKLETCYHGPCEYHPGQIRSHNDALDVSDANLKLGSDFLARGNVTLHEFQLWISTCYWDCCGGKLLEVGPEAAKRSQRKRRDAPKPWEVPHEYDGKLGCTRQARHLAIEV
ncbi:hypothetical protein F4781DRAFT_443031 [Annulohypoxylon bovei var. microspora]|nr:hypothetical protein F4781DRAFT_443031 [Annulohypoxylon bovei var. microspora]